MILPATSCVCNIRSPLPLPISPDGIRAPKKSITGLLSVCTRRNFLTPLLIVTLHSFLAIPTSLMSSLPLGPVIAYNSSIATRG